MAEEETLGARVAALEERVTALEAAGLAPGPDARPSSPPRNAISGVAAELLGKPSDNQKVELSPAEIQATETAISRYQGGQYHNPSEFESTNPWAQRKEGEHNELADRRAQKWDKQYVGRASIFQKGGWTAFAYSDSHRIRPGAEVIVYAKGVFDYTQMLQIAETKYPDIIKRSRDLGVNIVEDAGLGRPR